MTTSTYHEHLPRAPTSLSLRSRLKLHDHEHKVLVAHCAKGTMRWWLFEPPRGHTVAAIKLPSAKGGYIPAAMQPGVWRQSRHTCGHHKVMAALLIAQSAISYISLLISLTNSLFIFITNFSYKFLFQIFLSNFSYKYKEHRPA